MKAVCIHRRSDPPQLVVDDVSSPSPGAGEVLIQVRAAAVTPTELEWVPTWTTAAGAPRPFPIIPGHELSGDVVALGAGVARSWDVVRPGGRVVTIAASSGHTTDPRVRDAFFIVEPSRAQLADVAQAIDAGSLRVLVGGVFPLAEVQAAYAHRPPHGMAVLELPS